MLKQANDLDILKQTSSGDKRHRNSVTVAFDDEDLANKLHERIKDYIPQQVWVDKDCTNMGLRASKEQLYGRWTPHSINHRWRVACYPGQGHFGPHRDRCRIINEHCRSLITINGFLTDRPSGFGGATRFVKDDIIAKVNEDGIYSTKECDVLHRVEAEHAGTASVL